MHTAYPSIYLQHSIQLKQGISDISFSDISDQKFTSKVNKAQSSITMIAIHTNKDTIGSHIFLIASVILSIASD